MLPTGTHQTYLELNSNCNPYDRQPSDFCLSDTHFKLRAQVWYWYVLDINSKSHKPCLCFSSYYECLKSRAVWLFTVLRQTRKICVKILEENTGSKYEQKCIQHLKLFTLKLRKKKSKYIKISSVLYLFYSVSNEIFHKEQETTAAVMQLGMLKLEKEKLETKAAQLVSGYSFVLNTLDKLYWLIKLLWPCPCLLMSHQARKCCSTNIFCDRKFIIHIYSSCTLLL